MTFGQITLIQRKREVTEYLPTALNAAGVRFRKLEVSEREDLPILADGETVVLDAAADRWGLATAYQLRISRPAFTGSVLIGSFERKIDLLLAADGDILSTPGVTFVRFPGILSARLAVIFSTLMRPTPDELGRALTVLWRRRICARARILTHERGRWIGPLRQLLKMIATRRLRSDPKVVQDCVDAASGLPDWASRCDNLLCEAREHCAGIAEEDKLAPLAEELTRTLRLMSLNAQKVANVEALCRIALESINSIDTASKALDALQAPIG